MGIDEGPFQNITGISFPGFCAPGNIHPYFMQSGEAFVLYKDGVPSFSGFNVLRSPSVSYQRIAIPGSPTCEYAQFQLTVRIPKSADWPDCGYGFTSGGGFRRSYFPVDENDSSPVSCGTYNGPGVCVNITDETTRWKLVFVFKWDCACPFTPGDPYQGCGDPADEPPVG